MAVGPAATPKDPMRSSSSTGWADDDVPSSESLLDRLRSNKISLHSGCSPLPPSSFAFTMVSLFEMLEVASEWVVAPSDSMGEGVRLGIDCLLMFGAL